MFFMRLENNNASVSCTVYAKFDKKGFLKKWAGNWPPNKEINTHVHENSSAYEMLV